MDFINKLLDENYDWGDERIDEDVYDELSAELIIDYLKKHDPEIRQMLALSWNFDKLISSLIAVFPKRKLK